MTDAALSPFDRAHLIRCYRAHLGFSRQSWVYASKLTNLKLAANCRRKLLGLRPTIADYDYLPVEAQGSPGRVRG